MFGRLLPEGSPRANGGRNYTRQRLIEVSLVATPANSNALMMKAKALGISDAMIQRLLRPSVDASLTERQAHARAARQRALETIASVDERIAREAMDAHYKRQPGYLPPKAQAALDAAREKAEIEREAQRIVQRERDS
jgi:hypothetical protein